MTKRLPALAALMLLIAGGCALQPTPWSNASSHLAPTGTLRVALLDANAVHVIRDPASGEMKGISHDLGKALAGRLNVPFAPLLYPTIAGMLDAGRSGYWDVAFVGVTAERRAFLDFTGEHLEVDYGYLVPSGSKISDIRELDRAGVRLAVVETSSPDAFLSRTLKSASLVRAAALSGAIELLRAGKADAVAGLKPNMHAVSAILPGSRVLAGRLGAEGAALAIPKGRPPAALAAARHFVEEAKKGLVQQAIDRAGVPGVVVAPADATVAGF